MLFCRSTCLYTSLYTFMYMHNIVTHIHTTFLTIKVITTLYEMALSIDFAFTRTTTGEALQATLQLA